MSQNDCVATISYCATADVTTSVQRGCSAGEVSDLTCVRNQDLLAGRSGIRNLPGDVTEGTGVAVGGQVPSLEEDAIAGYDPERIISAKDRKKMDRLSLIHISEPTRPY